MFLYEPAFFLNISLERGMITINSMQPSRLLVLFFRIELLYFLYIKIFQSLISMFNILEVVNQILNIIIKKCLYIVFHFSFLLKNIQIK